MCGRYALYDISKAEFYIPQNMVGLNYNISPGTSVPVVTESYDVNLSYWTLSVAWAEKLRIINARSETLEIKKIFQNTKRCIFIANGYFGKFFLLSKTLITSSIDIAVPLIFRASIHLENKSRSICFLV